MNFERILVLSPHPDDGELGAGGTIAKFIQEGKRVHYIAFSSCEESLPEGLPVNTLKIECQKSTGTLGMKPKDVILLDYEVRTFPTYRQEILEYLVEFGRKIKPDLVLVPSSNDTHQDHQIIHNEAIRAFKKTASIWGYEHPWNNLAFTTDIFVELEEVYIMKKIKALSHYESQNIRNYLSEPYIKALAYTRGGQVDFTYAEAFELVRLLVRLEWKTKKR